MIRDMVIPEWRKDNTVCNMPQCRDTFDVISFEAVAQRLKNALSLKNDRALATALGLKSSAFYNRKSARSLPYDSILALADARHLCTDWIFFGIGHPFRDAQAKAPQPVAQLDRKLLQEICGELEAALIGPDARQTSKDVLYRATVRGGMAAFIYSKVVFIDNPTLRKAKIRSEAESMADAARVAKDAGELLERPEEPRSASVKRKRMARR